MKWNVADWLCIMWHWRGSDKKRAEKNSANVFYSNLRLIPASSRSLHGANTCIQSCLTSQAHFHTHWAVRLNANGQRADTSFPRRQMPKPVTRPSSQVFHPIYLSLLPMTRHVEMDTETLLHIDSGSSNSQARRGLSPASSFHFLCARERETARDRAGDNVSRQKSIFCSHPLALSQSIILGDSECHLWQRGASAAKAGKDWSRVGFFFCFFLSLHFHFSTFCSPVGIRKSEEASAHRY